MGYTLVLGGARSGKSTYAEKLASRYAELHSAQVVYLATAQQSDDEMGERIRRHRARRPEHWETVEVPCKVAEWLEVHKGAGHVVLIDCLSLLLNNWMFVDGCDDNEVMDRIKTLMTSMVNAENPVIVVSNEVGQGIVPGDALSRRYRDLLGVMNQAAAATAQHVIWVVAGIPVDLRNIQAQLP